LKKIIRQVKNRESAQASRIRRRDHLDYVEAKLKHEELVSSSWRQYSEMLKGLLLQHGVPVPPDPEIPAFVPPPPTEMSVAEPSRTLVRPLRTAGICLMLVVFSVGIIFNALHRSNPGNSISNVSGGSDNSLVAQAAVDPSARVIVDGSSAINQLTPTSESDTEITTTPSMASESNQPSSESESEATSLDVIRKSTYLSYDTDKTDSSLALVVSDQKEEVANPSSVSTVVPQPTCPVLRYASKTIFGDSQPHVAGRSWSMDNTSYILVNDASEFVPRNVYSNACVQPRTEPVIGLLLPASSFNISNTAPDDVVEVICGVRNANLVPRSVLAHSLC